MSGETTKCPTCGFALGGDESIGMKAMDFCPICEPEKLPEVTEDDLFAIDLVSIAMFREMGNKGAEHQVRDRLKAQFRALREERDELLADLSDAIETAVNLQARAEKAEAEVKSLRGKMK